MSAPKLLLSALTLSVLSLVLAAAMVTRLKKNMIV